MSKRKTNTDRALEQLDEEIRVRQLARELLVKLQPKPKPAKPIDVRPLLAKS